MVLYRVNDPRLALVEVKGPHDELRDVQRAWLLRLLSGGFGSEAWVCLVDAEDCAVDAP